jgi:hypothetical protein
MNPELVRFEQACNSLLTKRKMMPSRKIGLNAFCKYFTAFAWQAHCNAGDGFEMLTILEDDNQLVGGEIFNTNFVKNFEKLYSPALKNNQTWQRLITPLVEFKGKGVGAGEMYLALVISGWTFERTDGKGDGKVAGGIREVKNNGASLKPIHKSLSADQEMLNQTIFQGHRAGPLQPNKRSNGHSFARWDQWFKSHSESDRAEILQNMFSKLYSGRDVKNLCDALIKYNNGQDFYNIIGREVLRWYKQEDNWDSLVVIDQKNMTIANVADTSDQGLKIFWNLKFDWKSMPGNDTQALADGYVNITI